MVVAIFRVGRNGAAGCRDGTVVLPELHVRRAREGWPDSELWVALTKPDGPLDQVEGLLRLAHQRPVESEEGDGLRIVGIELYRRLKDARLLGLNFRAEDESWDEMAAIVPRCLRPPSGKRD